MKPVLFIHEILMKISVLRLKGKIIRAGSTLFIITHQPIDINEINTEKRSPIGDLAALALLSRVYCLACTYGGDRDHSCLK